MIDEPYLLVRAASLYFTVALTALVWMWRRPSRLALAGAILGFCWNLPLVLGLHLVAERVGWWHFDARGGLLLGMPVEAWLSWAWLWGALPALVFPSMPLAAVMLIALAIDLVLMPAAAPVVTLGRTWVLGDLVGLLAGLVPGQLLARWTIRGERLAHRTMLQIVAFTGLLLFILPVSVIEGSASSWRNPLDLPMWQLSLVVQMLAVPAVVGLTAVQEFVTRGRGTPVPFDPPQRLVTSGVYAYVRNPMQLSAVVLLLIIGFVLRNLWVAAASVMAHFYSYGLAGSDEDEDLLRRFGDDWSRYRRTVRSWLPRFRPWYRPEDPVAHLFVSVECQMCLGVWRWFACRSPRGLAIVPAETHSSDALTRITYEPADGSSRSSGIAAVSRALEHIHFGWALVAFFLRAPIVSTLAQLLADASGAQPRTIQRTSAMRTCPFEQACRRAPADREAR
jgi:protein-S-isoprenylcysteine O-methyltransferase Ste14